MEMTQAEIAAIVKNAIEEAMEAKNEGDRMDNMEMAIAEIKEALKELQGGTGENAAFEGKETKKEEEEEKKKEDATLENAKPAQALVAAFSKAFNTDFGAQTPSFSTLAALAGIKESDAALRIAAVNTKFTELSTAVAANTAPSIQGVF